MNLKSSDCLTSDKTKSQCLNDVLLGLFPSVAWSLRKFQPYFLSREKCVLGCLISHITSHGRTTIGAAVIVCCVCVCTHIHVCMQMGSARLTNNGLYYHTLVLHVLEFYIKRHTVCSPLCLTWLNSMLVSFILLHALLTYFRCYILFHCVTKQVTYFVDGHLSSDKQCCYEHCSTCLQMYIYVHFFICMHEIEIGYIPRIEMVGSDRVY